MKITKEQIKTLDPCKDGWSWYLNNQEEDLLTLLLKANKVNSTWSTWLFSRLMTKDQCVEISIYSAKKVLNIFEVEYPNDKRPRKAIEAADNYLNNPSEENKNAAYAAAADADAAAARAARAAWAAARAAWAAARAAWAAAAARAARAARAAARAARAARAAADATKLQEDIIKEAVRILDKGELTND